MLENSRAYCSFSVNDLSAARKFYSESLGLKVQEETSPGYGSMLTILLEGGGKVLVYEKSDHVPATFTVLNFPVARIEQTVNELKGKGILFEKYDGTDEKGITHGEGRSPISWFKDPAGNFLSVIEEENIFVKDELKINKFIPSFRSEIFKWWVTPELLEKWFYPDGMKVVVPFLEAKVGGNYTFEYFKGEDAYVCNGHFKDFITDIKLVQEESVRGPDRKLVYDRLLSTVVFNDIQGGTEISIIQQGFPEMKILREAADAWNQCLDRLSGKLAEQRSGVNRGFSHKSNVVHG